MWELIPSPHDYFTGAAAGRTLGHQWNSVLARIISCWSVRATQRSATTGVELVDGLEVAVDERLVDERPEVLGGLQLGTVRRLEDEADAVGHGEVLGSMPARIVELQHDALLLAGADRLGEVGEHGFEHLLADGVGDVPHRAPCRRLDESGHVEPLEAMVADRDGRSPIGAHTPRVIGFRPMRCSSVAHNLDRRVRMLAPLVGGGALEFF